MLICLSTGLRGNCELGVVLWKDPAARAFCSGALDQSSECSIAELMTNITIDYDNLDEKVRFDFSPFPLS